MSSTLTVIFADLTGSTPLYEALGNQRATETVVRLTRWIGEVMESHGGRVVKVLGDGVLGVFRSASDGTASAAELQRGHQIHLQRWPEVGRMEMHVGLATGDVLEVDGDAYGDAVNLAARLCERAGPGEIWTNDGTAAAAGLVPQVRFRKLGVFELRGKSEPQAIFQAEWRDAESPEMLTMQAPLHSAIAPLDSFFGTLQLSWQGSSQCYSSADMPVQVGRSSAAQLCIADPRVSRTHLRIDWHNSAFVLTDVSSFGTWVHYDGSDAAVAVRRDSCRLYGSGKIALGTPFETGGVLLEFRVAGNSMRLG